MRTTISLKYLVNDCRWKPFFDSNSPQTPSNLISLTVLVSLRPLILFQPKIRAIKSQKALNFALLGNCFSDLFNEVEIWY